MMKKCKCCDKLNFENSYRICPICPICLNKTLELLERAERLLLPEYHGGVHELRKEIKELTESVRDPIPSEETAALGRKAAVAEKDAIIAALREENANLRNRFQQLAGGFEIQGDHKSAERVRAAM
jgi:hypothetical protein